MPRNSNGDYSLPAGNPVVTGTTISSTWANTTLEDVANAITDSLSRTGDGGMQAPLFLDNGAIGAPALSWGSETTSGLYRAGAGDFRWAMGGTDKVQILTTGLNVLAGSAASPSFSIITDPNTGLYSVGADDLGFTTGGVLRMDISTTAITSTLPLLPGAGTAGAPSHSFSGDPNTGVYSVGADDWGVSTNGTLRFDISTTAVTSTLPWRGQDGVVGIPGISFSSDTDTGFYRFGANSFGATAGGSGSAYFYTQGLSLNDGTALLPALFFDSDKDTGFYRRGSGDMGITTNGTLRMVVSDTFIAVNPQALFSDGTSNLAPGISFNSDPNTGIYRNSADTISIIAGGNGTVVGSVNGSGVGAVTLGNSNLSDLSINCVSSGSASAGGTAIPTAAGFLTVTINGTVRKIPYCAN